MIRVILAIIMFISVSNGFVTDAAKCPPPKRSASSQRIVNRSVNIGSFTKIEAETAINVKFTQGPATGRAVISAQEDMIDYVKLDVKNDILYIRLQRKANRTYLGPFTISVQAPVLKSIELSAASSFVMEGTLNVKGDFNVDISGASNVNIPVLKSTNLTLDPSGASYINMKQVECSNVIVDCSGASKVMLDEVLSPKLTIDASGASMVNVDNFSGHTLNVETSGTSSSKVYTTDAETLNLSASGVSNIEVGNVNANIVNADASSQSVIYVNGKARNWNRDVSGGGKIKTNTKKITSSSSSSSSSNFSWNNGASKNTKKSAKTEKKKSKKSSPTQAP